MKNSKEIAASVFEKSRVIIDRRRQRRKRIAAAASALGAAVVVTAAAIVGSDTFSLGRSILTSDVSSESSTVVSAESSAVGIKSEKENSASSLRSAVTSSGSVSEKSSESSKSSDTSHRNESSADSVSSTAHSSRPAQSSRSSRAAISVKPGENDVSDDDSSSEPESRSELHAESRLTADCSKAASVRLAESRASSSKAVSSKSSSSKSNSSKSSSSKSSSSKNTVSSKTQSNIPSSQANTRSTLSERTSSTVHAVTSSKPPISTDSDKALIKDDSDIPNSPDNQPPDIDFPTVPVEFDTDIDAEAPVSDSSEYFYDVEDARRKYATAEELVAAADRVVIAYINGFSYDSVSDELGFLSKDIVKPDYPQDDQNPRPYGDILTVYRFEILDELKGSSGNNKNDSEELWVYGGRTTDYYLRQMEAMHSDDYIPIVDGLETMYASNVYILLLDDSGSVTTLVNYTQSIYDYNNPYSVNENNHITEQEIIAACK